MFIFTDLEIKNCFNTKETKSMNDSIKKESAELLTTNYKKLIIWNIQYRFFDHVNVVLSNFFINYDFGKFIEPIRGISLYLIFFINCSNIVKLSQCLIIKGLGLKPHNYIKYVIFSNMSIFFYKKKICFH